MQEMSLVPGPGRPHHAMKQIQTHVSQLRSLSVLRAREPQPWASSCNDWSPRGLEPMLHNEKPLQGEARAQLEERPCSNEDPAQPEYINK